MLDMIIYKIKAKILLLFNIIYIKCTWYLNGELGKYKLYFTIINKSEKLFMVNVDDIKKHYKAHSMKSLLDFCRCIAFDVVDFMIEYEPNQLKIEYDKNNVRSGRLISAYISGFLPLLQEYELYDDLRGVILKKKGII